MDDVIVISESKSPMEKLLKRQKGAFQVGSNEDKTF